MFVRRGLSDATAVVLGGILAGVNVGKAYLVILVDGLRVRLQSLPIEDHTKSISGQRQRTLRVRPAYPKSSSCSLDSISSTLKVQSGNELHENDFR